MRTTQYHTMPKPQVTEVAPASRAMLGLLGHLHAQGRKHIYAGTVSAKVIAKRRAKNKLARRSRRINRVVGA